MVDDISLQKLKNPGLSDTFTWYFAVFKTFYKTSNLSKRPKIHIYFKKLQHFLQVNTTATNFACFLYHCIQLNGSI